VLLAVRSTSRLKLIVRLTDMRNVSIAPHHPWESVSAAPPLRLPRENAFRAGSTAPPHSAGQGWDEDAGTAPVSRKPTSQRGRGLHGQLVQQLGHMIVAGELDLERPLVPEDIGHRFEVSRTVVRESLRVLEAKGLVSARPNVGTRVRPVSDWNLLDPDIIEWRAYGPQREDQRRELFELRWGMEPLAAHLAAERGDPASRTRLLERGRDVARAVAQGDLSGFARADADLHLLLLQASGNRMLAHMGGIVASALSLSGGAEVGCDGASDQAAGRHAMLVAAIEEGDGTGAERAARILLADHPEVRRLFPDGALSANVIE
jgi:DNA-binding FadR family transcriptional regulator